MVSDWLQDESYAPLSAARQNKPLRAESEGPAQIERIASFTFAGVNGTDRSRTPTAS
jgi:hypothetical protein